MTPPEHTAIAGGQVQRVVGASREVALHEQLYRYAQDFHELLEQKNELEERYQALTESYRQLSEGREVLDNLIHASHDMHLTTTPSGTILQCNAAAGRIVPTAVLVGQSLRTLVLPSHRNDFDALLAETNRGGDVSLVERELWLRGHENNGAKLIVAVRLMPIFKDEAVEAIHWMVRDLTRAREAEFDSQISSLVFRSATEGIMITDLEGEILAINPAFTQITGYVAAEVIGRSPSILKSGVQDADFYQKFWTSLREKGQWQGEVFNRKKSGEIYPEWLTVTAARDSEGRILSYIAVFSDMSRLQEAEKRLSYMAYHDTLTGLPNRLLLMDRTRQAIAQSRRAAFPLTVLFIDLDGFKQVNDSLGHEAGDHVLQETARRLQQVVRESDTVGRIGGDEFVVVASGLHPGKDTVRLAEKLLASLSRQIPVGDRVAAIGCSIGIAWYEDGMTTETLLHQADEAMYRAKRAGGNCYIGHATEMDAESSSV